MLISVHSLCKHVSNICQYAFFTYVSVLDSEMGYMQVLFIIFSDPDSECETSEHLLHFFDLDEGKLSSMLDWILSACCSVRLCEARVQSCKIK